MIIKIKSIHPEQSGTKMGLESVCVLKAFHFHFGDPSGAKIAEDTGDLGAW